MMEQFVARMPRQAVASPLERSGARPARAIAMMSVLGISIVSWVALGYAVGLI